MTSQDIIQVFTNMFSFEDNGKVIIKEYSSKIIICKNNNLTNEILEKLENLNNIEIITKENHVEFIYYNVIIKMIVHYNKNEYSYNFEVIYEDRETK